MKSMPMKRLEPPCKCCQRSRSIFLMNELFIGRNRCHSDFEEEGGSNRNSIADQVRTKLKRRAVAVRRACLMTACWIFISISTLSQEVEFATEVFPIFERNCLECHAGNQAESGLRLDEFSGASLSGDLYPQLVIPGNAEESPLFRILTGREADLKMPPNSEPLQGNELELIRRWIDEGAILPSNIERRSPSKSDWWSLKQVVQPQVPTAKSGGELVQANPIDCFIDGKLIENGLMRSPPSNRRTLAMRLSLVLTGLPASYEELAVLAAGDDAELEHYIDRLLASPHFGERWGTHWLDVVRFAESDGFETNHERPNAYHYRDYVIASFNGDARYDQFVIEQLAGDRIGKPAATGFIVGGARDIVQGQDDDLTAIQRYNELADMVGTTASTFLGLTVGCARCHQHKFDPISQTDYYAFVSVFAGVRHGEVDVEAEDEQVRLSQVVQLTSQLADIEKRLEGRVRPKVTHLENIDAFEARRAKFLRFTILACSTVEPCIDELEVFGPDSPGINVALAAAGTRAISSGDYIDPARHRLEFINDGMYSNERSWISNTAGGGWVMLEFPGEVTIDKVIWSRDRRHEGFAYQDRLATEYRIETSLDGEEWRLASSSDDRLGSKALTKKMSVIDEEDVGSSDLRSLLTEREALLSEIANLQSKRRMYVGRFENPPPTHRLHRGEHSQPREVVEPNGLEVLLNDLGSIQLANDADESERRFALAHWIVDPKNPLTARVMVNRIWQNIFGVGLVATPSDLGRMGALPTHPELLDWLAVEFQKHDWSVKYLVRLIVTSEVFRQASAPMVEALSTDAQNRLLWRFSPRRIEGESIRDRMLAAAGLLDRTMGGPSYLLFVPNDNYSRNWVAKNEFEPSDFRRMIYAMKIRMEPDSVFAVFDIPDAGQICPKRARSTTPLQAMNLFNSRWTYEVASRLAAHLDKNATSAEERVRQAFQSVLAREPDAEEERWSLSLIEKHGMTSLVRALLNTNEFLWIE